MEVKTADFKHNAQLALGDPQLQRALGRVMPHFDEARRAAIAAITPQRWEELRERARAIKRHTLDNLDYYLDLLARRVNEAGGVVHFARSDEEVRQIVVRLAGARGVRSAVKGKSMISEEVGLNHALEAAGVEVTETDLGEYIIQLAEETPFHIVAPAMHKTKEQVSELFLRRLGEPRQESIPDLAQRARQTLRPKFLAAEMGVSGVNFAVAETGTIVLVTNEGNGQLSTSLPRLHVALMGMEKVVPNLEDMAIFLRLLARSATGQHLTTYTTFISGPRRADDEDGPEEFHLVIVDNGRSNLLRDPGLREALYCIRCGACLNICPVYGKVGGHAYGWVYSGPIGSVVTPMLVGLERAKDLPFASSLCGACREVCPLKIDIPHMLLKLRQRVAEGDRGRRGELSTGPELVEGRGSWFDRLTMSGVQRLTRSGVQKLTRSGVLERLLMKAWYLTVRDGRAFALAHRLGTVVQRPLARDGRLRRIPLPLFSAWTRQRDFPALAPKTFRQLWRERLSKG